MIYSTKCPKVFFQIFIFKTIYQKEGMVLIVLVTFLRFSFQFGCFPKKVES